MTVNTRIIKLFLQDETLTYVPLESGLRLQILPTISHLPECQKHHFAAFIQDYQILVVWDDDPNHVLKRVQSIEDQLISMVWKEEMNDDESAAPVGSAIPSTTNLNTGDSSADLEKTVVIPTRRIVLIQPVLTALTLILLVAAIGSGWRQIRRLTFSCRHRTHSTDCESQSSQYVRRWCNPTREWWPRGRCSQRESCCRNLDPLYRLLCRRRCLRHRHGQCHGA